MKKLAIVITDGVGFRNFVLSDFLPEAQRRFGEVVILSFLPAAIYKGITDCRVIELVAMEETFKTWFFRKAKELAHLQLHKPNNFGIGDNLKTNSSKSKTPRGHATRLLLRWTSRFHTERWIGRYTRLQQRTFKNHSITKSYQELLEEENFNLLFFTHQRPPFVAPLVYLAQKMQLRTCSFIFSWDNLASKGRMAADFDLYLVWSELMKQDLMHFYPTTDESTIKIVGTPQFEPYVLERYAMDKAAFMERFRLDPLNKTLCFSCGDISTSRNDELYIEIIAEAVKDGSLPDVNVIVRTSPAEDPVRFKQLAEKYPFLHWNYPDWRLSREKHQETWSQRVPSIADVKDLRALLEHSDLNINMLSTMSLDFMLFDKPVINPVFGNDSNGLYNDGRFLKYAHIENVLDSKATRIATNKKELLEAITYYLENPEADKVNRKALVALEIGCPLEGTGERIAKQLLEWV